MEDQSQFIQYLTLLLHLVLAVTAGIRMIAPSALLGKHSASADQGHGPYTKLARIQSTATLEESFEKLDAVV